ncbi:MAG: YibE/F family protein [Spirochaetaceae bacterium]|nr:YibE/F family protein [Spirochaetaceae bacterium]
MALSPDITKDVTMEVDEERIKITLTPSHFFFLFTVVVAGMFLFFGHKICHPYEIQTQEDSFFSAKVLQVLSDETNQDEYVESEIIRFKAELKSGPEKGRVITAVQEINSMINESKRKIQSGDSVILIYLPDNSGDMTYLYSTHKRTTILAVLMVVFFVCILAIGHKKGVFTIFSLGFVTVAIFSVYIPGILSGLNIYVLTSVVSFFCIFVSIILINGVNKKSFSAILGNVLGVILSALCAALMSHLLDFTGIFDVSYFVLRDVIPGKQLDLRAVLWGGIVISSLGAIMDISMSIASALNEVYENMGQKSFLALWKSGMEIGKDAIGTMTNTLILAYIGSALGTVLLYSAYNKNIVYLLNSEPIAAQVVQAVVGSMGILFAVPTTAVTSAILLMKNGD